MKTYRLGNTITIRWTISLANGEPFTLNSETVELVAIAPHHSMIIDDFTVESNVLTWIFKGSEQKYLGPYTLTLIQNRGKVDMVTVDICEAFALVPWSCMAGGTDAAGVETESLEISSTVSATQVTLSPEVEAAIKTATDPKQDKEDPTLQTKDKTIPGAINEIKEETTFPVESRINAAEDAANWDYGYINSTGVLIPQTSGSYKHSDKINIVSNSTIEIKQIYNIPAIRAVAAYTKDGIFVDECSYNGNSIIESRDDNFTIDTNGYNIAYIIITAGGGFASYNIQVSTYSYTSLKEKIVDIENNITQLQESVNSIGIGEQWNNASWVALGTSITDTKNTSAPDGTATGKFVPILQQLSKMQVVDKGVAGSVIGGHILYYATHTPEMSNAKLITIEGGVNDWISSKPLGKVGDTIPYLVEFSSPEWNNGGNDEEGTFAGACYQVFKQVMTNAPKSQIVVITDNTGKKIPTTGANCERSKVNTLGLTQNDYTQMFIDVAKYMGVPVIDAGRESMVNEENEQYLIDQIHHTDLGGEQFAKTIWTYLKNMSTKAKEVQ